MEYYFVIKVNHLCRKRFFDPTDKKNKLRNYVQSDEHTHPSCRIAALSQMIYWSMSQRIM